MLEWRDLFERRGSYGGLNGYIRPKKKTKKEKQILTFSSFNMFRNCPRAYKFKVLDWLSPIQKNENLLFGSIVHKCLEIWYQTGDAKAVYRYIDNCFPHREEFLDKTIKTINPFYGLDQKEMYFKITAMMDGYFLRYPQENFTVQDVEMCFTGDIFNPLSGAESKSFKMSGKIDMLVREKNTDRMFLIEHKTAADIGENYLSKLPCDTQISLYSLMIEQTQGIKIDGIIYNILGKTRIHQDPGETEEEFQVRYMEACSKNKSGKSTATRKMPETDEQFQERLAQKYSSPETDKYHREMIVLEDCYKIALQRNLWSYLQNLLYCKRDDFFPQNHANCYNCYQRQCDYFPICYAPQTEQAIAEVIAEKYVKIEPHEELRKGEFKEKLQQNEDKREEIPSFLANSPEYPTINYDSTGKSQQQIISELFMMS